MIFDLPESLEVNGREYDIRTDFRDILQILAAYDDPELQDNEKQFICLYLLYVDFPRIPPEDYQAAYAAAVRFIDNGAEKDGHSPRSMDWEQDAALLFPAVNKAAGYEVRAVEYLHWWTFIGFFMEIKDSTYASVLALRQKRNRGKKLEKSELEFWNQNRGICELKKKLNETEQKEYDTFNALFQ